MLNHRARATRALFALATLGVSASPAAAQYSPITAAPVQADPGAVLAEAMHTLATQPKDLAALLAAGHASADMGDMQAAAGFFGRAEEYYPASPAAKIGVGAAMTMMGDAKGAMVAFDRAQALGAPPAMLGLDRGLAYDLLGQQARAQADYRAVLSGAKGDEARRRLALSLAISKDIRGAAAMLEPLLARRDAAAVRTNAFVLALAGDREGARRTIEAALPGAGARFEPFFRMLPVLRPEEKAAAVHLGEFPKDAAQRYAQAAPIPSSPVVSIGNRAVMEIAPRPAFTQIQMTPRKNAKVVPLPPPPVKVAAVDAPLRAVRMAPLPSTSFARSRPSLDPSQWASRRRKADTVAASSTPPAKTVEQAPKPGFKFDDLAPVDDTPEPLVLVGQNGTINRDGEPIVTDNVVLEPPPSPSLPKVEKAKPKPKAREVAKKVEPAKAKELAKPKEPPSLLYVQLASGAHPDRMGTEYKRIKAKKPGLFAGRNARVTNGKELFRLVIGPFKTRDDSDAFVNQLSKAGISGFSYTAPGGMTFDNIPTR